MIDEVPAALVWESSPKFCSLIHKQEVHLPDDDVLFYIYKGSISQIPNMGVTSQSDPYHSPFTMLVPTWVNQKSKMKMVKK